MSYGWLTESSLIPQPGVDIDVSSSSMATLKEVVHTKTKQNEQERIRLGTTKTKPTAKVISREERLMRKTNEGVEARRQLDSESSGPGNGDALSLSEQKLREKAALYDLLADSEKRQLGNPLGSVTTSSFVVDFAKKRREGKLCASESTASPPAQSLSSAHLKVEGSTASSPSGVSDGARGHTNSGEMQKEEADSGSNSEAKERRDALLNLTSQSDKCREEASKKRATRETLRNRLEALREEKRAKR